jgi:hypothetical protein
VWNEEDLYYMHGMVFTTFYAPFCPMHFLEKKNRVCYGCIAYGKIICDRGFLCLETTIMSFGRPPTSISFSPTPPGQEIVSQTCTERERES